MSRVDAYLLGLGSLGSLLLTGLGVRLPLLEESLGDEDVVSGGDGAIKKGEINSAEDVSICCTTKVAEAMHFESRRDRGMSRGWTDRKQSSDD